MITPIKKAVDIVGSQTELARLLGVTRPAVNSWVKNRNRIPPAKAELIEKLTGVSAVSLVFPHYEHKKISTKPVSQSKSNKEITKKGDEL